MNVEGAVDALVRFSRMVSGKSGPDEILPLLAESGVDLTRADAAAVLTVAGAEVQLVAAKNLPPSLAGFRGDHDIVGSELARALVAASQGAFARAVTLPIISTGDLFGALVLFTRAASPLPPEELRVAEGLADLAAASLRSAFQLSELSRSFAELRASRELLRRGEKLRALGQMAAGVAHDLKNILNPLSLRVQLFKRRAQKPGAVDELLASIDEVVRHGLGTVERLRAFSRQSPETPGPPGGEPATPLDADLDAAVAEAVALCKPRLDDRRGIVVSVEPGAPPPVRVHGPELLTSLVNLIVNAVDAMPEGGSLRVRTGRGDDGASAWVEVADSGCGIPPEVQGRIFEPFFTTKGEDGTGLGLAMVYAFVQRHDGSIAVDTAPGNGTTFRLSFPIAISSRRS